MQMQVQYALYYRLYIRLLAHNVQVIMECFAQLFDLESGAFFLEVSPPKVGLPKGQVDEDASVAEGSEAGIG